jgi:urease accessory protein
MHDGGMAVPEETRQRADAAPTRLLQVWLSPGFPVGAFAFSHGLEWAVDAGRITDQASLEAWLRVLLTRGSARNDMILLAAAWRASDPRAPVADLAVVAELALALQPSGERYLETTVQGTAFVQQIRSAWPAPAIDRLGRTGSPVAYPVAVGVAASGHGIALTATLDAYALAFVSNLTSAAIRLSVIGQTGAQRVIAALLGDIDLATAAAVASTLDDVGGAGWMADFASLAHETQYTRLFRS